VPAGRFAVLQRIWRPGDLVELRFPMKAKAVEWQNNSVVVERGPVLFSLNIATEWRRLRSQGMTADWEARPRSAWNYSLQLEKRDQLVERTRPAAAGKSIFSLENAPVTIEIQGRKTPEWKAENDVAGELPPGL
jgi:uncharacterized protein